MSSSEPSWPEIVAGIREGLERAVKEWMPVIRQLGRFAYQVQKSYRQGVPPSWQQFEASQAIEVIELMQRTGWCLTMSPPSEALVEMLEASDDDARGALLIREEPRILDDLDRELREVQARHLPLVVEAARQALESHASGFFLASQSLSGNALASILERRGPFGLKSLGQARERLRQLDVEEASLGEVRYYAVAAAVVQAFETFPRDGALPPLFNRHATAHAITDEQYSQLNSLTALMLLIGFLREVAWLMQTQAEEARSDDERTAPS